MPGKTISAHADEETAQLVERLARLEDRSPSQIAAAALALYVRLPSGAHASLRYVQAMGTEADYGAMSREVARAIGKAHYRISHRRLIGSAQPEVEGLESEEDILAEAVRMATDPPRKEMRIHGKGGERAADTRAPARRRRS